MTNISRTLSLLLVLGFAALSLRTPLAAAQVMGLGAPMTARFVGTFTPWAKDTPRGPESLMVTVKGKKFFFHVKEVGSYHGSDPTMMLVQHIFPPELEFLGPRTRLAPLLDPTKDRSYAVEGWLYAGDNMFYVAAVKALGN